MPPAPVLLAWTVVSCRGQLAVHVYAEEMLLCSASISISGNHEAHVTCMLGIEWKGRRITMLLLLLMKVLLHLRNWHTPLSL